MYAILATNWDIRHTDTRLLRMVRWTGSDETERDAALALLQAEWPRVEFSVFQKVSNGAPH